MLSVTGGAARVSRSPWESETGWLDLRIRKLESRLLNGETAGADVTFFPWSTEQTLMEVGKVPEKLEVGLFLGMRPNILF